MAEQTKDTEPLPFDWGTVITRLKEQDCTYKEGIPYPHVNIYLQDGQDIVDSRLTVFVNPKSSACRVYFKLSNGEIPLPAPFTPTQYTYEGIAIAQANEYNLDNQEALVVSSGLSPDGNYQVRSLTGQAYLEISSELTADVLSQAVNRGMQVLGITSSEMSYRKPFQSIETRMLDEMRHGEIAKDASYSTRKAIDGYETYYADGRAEVIRGMYGDFTFLHKVSSSDHLPNILASGGLLSFHERCKLGLVTDKDLFFLGLGQGGDLNTGGGDGVFVRFYTARGLEVCIQAMINQLDYTPQMAVDSFKLHDWDVCLVPAPEDIARLDFTIFKGNAAGNTGNEGDIFRSNLLGYLGEENQNGYLIDNETTFNVGIKVTAIACGSSETMSEVITTINNSQLLTDDQKRQWVDRVFVADHYADVIDLAWENPVGQTKVEIKAKLKSSDTT